MGRNQRQGNRDSGSAFAIAAHPDDIEFYMAGTLLLLKEAGFSIHYMTLSSGSCGSLRHDANRTRKIRRLESQRAAAILGAQYHGSLTDDLEIFYDIGTLRRLAAVVREVKPRIVLTHSPQDYMEDHMNACRLAVTAVFARGMPNFVTEPARQPGDGDAFIYHAMPHGLRDPLRRKVVPGSFVNTSSVHLVKREALAAHQSQKAWLDVSQGMDSYLKAMDKMSLEVGRMSRGFKHAEGWRRHLHIGFSGRDEDPLQKVLGSKYQINKANEASLEKEL
ncbi:MAG: LmbE family protein [Verrucomicrobiales bacterium]|nr:LmbE family protein [Verrucomicrobiales bacterium]